MVSNDLVLSQQLLIIFLIILFSRVKKKSYCMRIGRLITRATYQRRIQYSQAAWYRLPSGLLA